MIDGLLRGPHTNRHEPRPEARLIHLVVQGSPLEAGALLIHENRRKPALPQQLYQFGTTGTVAHENLGVFRHLHLRKLSGLNHGTPHQFARLRDERHAKVTTRVEGNDHDQNSNRAAAGLNATANQRTLGARPENSLDRRRDDL